jgi:hypothetical protein
MKKQPYIVDSNIGTTNGIIKEFNGFTMPSGTPHCAERFSKDNPFCGVVRVETADGMGWRYFLNGKEYMQKELFA